MASCRPQPAALNRNGNVGGYFCHSRLNHYCRGHRPQTKSVLLNAWKGKNPPPLVPNVPIQGSRRGLCCRCFGATVSYATTLMAENLL